MDIVKDFLSVSFSRKGHNHGTQLGGGRGGGGGDFKFFLRVFDLIKLQYFLYVFGKISLRKQCRPRPDAAERGVWSGSTLYATHQAIVYTFICCKMDFIEEKFKVERKGRGYI